MQSAAVLRRQQLRHGIARSERVHTSHTSSRRSETSNAGRRGYAEIFSFNQVPVIPPVDPKVKPKGTLPYAGHRSLFEPD